MGLKLSNLFKYVASRLLFYIAAIICSFAGTVNLTLAQNSAHSAVIQLADKRSHDAVPRNDFFATESLGEKARLLSEKLLFQALDSEAFYTIVGQIKPVSEGFWGGYFPVDRADLSEINEVREALCPWNVPGLFFADVLVYESIQYGQRYASAYVVHLPSLKKLVEHHGEFFARWGITGSTPAAEVMMAIERSRKPDDRWRAFGRLFGYPEYAIDFFVAAGMHQRMTGEFVERDFRQIPTFGSRLGRFVFAVPKLSLPSPEDIQLQRRAAMLLSEYRRLRPEYVTPTTNPSGLLRDWMDDGTEACHPEHVMNKLPSNSEAEIDAEIESWNKPEIKPPELKFNHLYVVLNHEDFESVRDSDFVRNHFAASDQGFPNFLPVDEQCQSIYLRGRDTYLELFGPKNKFNEPIGKIGIGWTVEKVGELDLVEPLLAKGSPDTFTRVLKRWDFDRDGAGDWYHSLFRTQPPSADAVWWFSEYHVDFIPSLYPGKSLQGAGTARRDFLESRYDAKRLIKNVNSLTIELPLKVARMLRSDLEKLGWRSDNFDERTWILRDRDFRLMVLVHAEVTTSKLKSIGFETNTGVNRKDTQLVGEHIDFSFDGSGSGWIDFQR